MLLVSPVNGHCTVSDTLLSFLHTISLTKKHTLFLHIFFMTVTIADTIPFLLPIHSAKFKYLLPLFCTSSAQGIQIQRLCRVYRQLGYILVVIWVESGSGLKGLQIDQPGSASLGCQWYRWLIRYTRFLEGIAMRKPNLQMLSSVRGEERSGPTILVTLMSGTHTCIIELVTGTGCGRRVRFIW